ncbi:MAG TPA: class I SAM-dependent methyltransferase, partial [Candidatus Syntrophosphaera sp.]|nr:class I SAM-dependent methyltransferase [Candidatus Syntrophosphaera sp.]
MDYYSEHTWKHYDSEGRSLERLACIKKMIPEDVKTILDAGCGNGIITNELARDYEVTALDPSAIALQYVQCAKICASIDAIPFPDNSFDLVCSNEVLEHLDDITLQKGIQE